MTRPLHQKRDTRLFLSFFLIVFFILFQGSALASITPPTFERLAPISANVNSPTGLAVDQQGRVYVAETRNNRVVVFSQSGKFIHAITGQDEPICITVGANGNIYIGNKNSGNVTVHDSGFAFLFKLGQGDGEFGLPSDITVDNAANKIFVADRINSTVKAYNANGSFNSTIGQTGNGDGQVQQPISLTIDPIAGELIILDQQQRRDTFYGTMIKGARIQYFDLNGNFLRGYSKFGYNIDAGELAKPIHAAVDEASRLYVTDARWQKVMVYDSNNTYLGMIENGAHPLRIPLGLTMGSTSRLYVSSHRGDQVEVYGIDNYTAMDLTPPVLSFQAVEGGAPPAPQSTTINNNGKTGLNWTARSDNSWLTLADAAGSILVSGSRSLEVGLNTEGLSPGIYKGSIEITIDENIKETVSVELDLQPNPLQIGPTPLIFTAEVGTTPAGQAVSVSSDKEEEPVDWTAAADQGWISISKSTGATPEDVRVYANTANMTAGTYSGTVTFDNTGDDPAPVEVAVTLNLTDPGETPVVEPPETTPPGQNTNKLKWTVTQVVPGTSLNGVWGSSPRNIFAVGAEGAIIQNDGSKWSTTDSGSSSTLYSIWGSSGENIYAVGESGLVLHYDGTSWSPVETVTEETLHDVTGTESDIYAVDTFGSILSDSLASASDSGVALRSIWGSSDSDIFVAGEAGAILHFDGIDWNFMDSDTTQWLNGVWGSSESNVFAVGENGAIVHYDGTIWSAMDSGTSETLQSVWGGSGSNVFAVGTSGLILHYNGNGWNPVSSGAEVTLNDVWVSSKSAVYAVGDDGIIISGKSKFPWMHFITSTILVSAAKNNDEDDEKSDKGLMPVKIVEDKDYGIGHESGK